MDRFAGKVVVITGAANGIGAAAARRFSSEGATVVLADYVEDDVMKMAATLPEDRTTAMVVDVSDPKAVEKMIEDTVRKYGKLDVMINNAGVHVVGSVLETSLDDWRRISGINIDGVVYGAKFSLPQLIRSKGCMINTSCRVRTGRRLGCRFLLRIQGSCRQPDPCHGTGSWTFRRSASMPFAPAWLKTNMHQRFRCRGSGKIQ